MPFLELKDAKIYYETKGQGKPLVLISGYASDHLFWLPIVDRLAENFQVITFDNRGIGQTISHNHPLTISIMAKDVVALIEHLNLKKAHVAGHSMGGMIAQEIAIHHSIVIDKLALLNTAAYPREAALLILKALLDARLQNTPLELIVEMALPLFYADSFLKDKRRVDEIKKLLMANQQPIDGQKAQYNALLHFNNRALSKIKVPTLVGSGDFDIITLPSEAHILDYEIDQTTLVTYPSGHAAISEIPEKIVSILKDFFREPI